MTKENESHVMSRLFLEIASSTSDVAVGDALEFRRVLFRSPERKARLMEMKAKRNVPANP